MLGVFSLSALDSSSSAIRRVLGTPLYGEIRLQGNNNSPIGKRREKSISQSFEHFLENLIINISSPQLHRIDFAIVKCHANQSLAVWARLSAFFRGD